MANLVSGSSYTINSLIGEKNTNYTLSGAIATNGAKGFMEYSSNIYFQQESGGIFIATPALDPAPTVDVSTITFSGYASNGQVITQSISPTKKLIVNVTASAGAGDFLEYGGETRLITSAEFAPVQDLLFSAYQLTLNDIFTTNPIRKVIGSNIAVAPGVTAVSGSSYKILSYVTASSGGGGGGGRGGGEEGPPPPVEPSIILQGVNPYTWPANGAYVQYSGQQYWLRRETNGANLKSITAFDPAPVLELSTVTYLREPVANEIYQYSDGTLYVTPTVTALDPNYNYGGYKLNYNGESRYITETTDITGEQNYFAININSAFTTSPIAKLLGTEVTLGDAPVNGQVVNQDFSPSLQVITGSVVNVGDQLTYSGETITVVSVNEIDQFVYLYTDIGFSNDPIGKVLGVDITITAAPPAPTGKRLIPPPGERTVPENDLTPDVRDVPRNDLVPDVINKNGLIPSWFNILIKY